MHSPNTGEHDCHYLQQQWSASVEEKLQRARHYEQPRRVISAAALGSAAYASSRAQAAEDELWHDWLEL